VTTRQEENPLSAANSITQHDWNRQVSVLQAKGVPSDIASDCVQEGFLAVASCELEASVHNFNGLWHVASWRRYLNMQKSGWGQRVRTVEPELMYKILADVMGEEEHFSDAVEVVKSEDILSYLVSDVRPRPRQIVEAYFERGGSLVETAAWLEIPLHKLKWLLAEAERLLRRRWPNLRL
jgi:DNA-directed RNA polymerase specialized sigma24 family protein